MRKPRSLYQIACDAAFLAANRARLDLVCGRISVEEFRARRLRQSKAAHDRIEGILARLHPGYKPLPFTAGE